MSGTIRFIDILDDSTLTAFFMYYFLNVSSADWSLLLKRQCYEIFDPRFFSLINPLCVTDYHPKIFLNLVAISPICSRIYVNYAAKR
jgi:hypothetical protein